MVEQARQLNPEERLTWAAYLQATQSVGDAMDRKLQREADMPHAYYTILLVLNCSHGSLRTMSELAHKARFTPSRLSHAVGKLEKRGWVRRERLAECQRMTTVALTEAGYAALEDASPAHDDQVRRVLFDQLSETEQAQLRSICEKIAAAAPPPGCPDG